MSTSVDYIKQKLDAAVYALATGDGDIRSRIDAAHSCFWHIPEEDFPESIQEERREITKLLTLLPGRKGYIIPDNLKQMDSKTAVEIARLILIVQQRVTEERLTATNRPRP